MQHCCVLSLRRFNTNTLVWHPMMPVVLFVSVYDDLSISNIARASSRGHVRTCCRLGYARFPLDSLENQQRPALVAWTSRLLLRGTNP